MGAYVNISPLKFMVKDIFTIFFASLGFYVIMKHYEFKIYDFQKMLAFVFISYLYRMNAMNEGQARELKALTRNEG